jgi:hypothetical protein
MVVSKEAYALLAYKGDKQESKVIKILRVEFLLHRTNTETLCTVYSMTSADNGKFRNTYSEN